MPKISAQHAEDLITRIHAGKVVDPDAIPNGTRGAIPVHPTGLVAGNTKVFPVQHTVAPGVPLPPGVHENNWQATTRKDGQTVVLAHGVNYIVVGEGLPAPDPKAYKADGTPLPHVPTEFRNYSHPVMSTAALRRAAHQIIRDAKVARERLIQDLDAHVRNASRSLDVHDRAGHSREDVAQVAREKAIKAVDDYIDPSTPRPHTTITGFVFTRVKRDVPREVRRTAGASDETVRLASFVNAQEDADSLDSRAAAVRYHADSVRAARAKSFSGKSSTAATEAQLAATERNMERVMRVRALLKPQASLDRPVGDSDGSTYLRDTVDDPSAQEAFEDVEQGNAIANILGKWFAGAGVDTARLTDLVRIMAETGGNPTMADLNSSSESEYIQWALTPLRQQTESWTEQADVTKIMARFGQLVSRQGQVKSEVDIANGWSAYQSHREYADRPAVPNYFTALAF